MQLTYQAPQAGLRRPTLYAALTLQTLLLIVLLVPVLFSSLADVSAGMSLSTAVQLATANALLGLGVTWLFTRTLWDPRLLLYISLVAFNAGALIGNFLDPGHLIVPRLFEDAQLVAAAYFTTLCLAAWTLGTVISQMIKQTGKANVTLAASTAKIRTVGVAFLVLGTVPALLETLDAIRLVAAGGYISLYQQDVVVGAANWRAVAGAFFIPGLIWLLGSSTLAARGRRNVLLIALAYGAVRFSLGARSEALLPVIAVLFVWHHQVQRIPRKWVLSVSAVLIFILLPAAAILRNANDSFVRLSPSAVAEVISSSSSPLTATLFETGGSILPTIYTLNVVPEARPFDYGSYYVRSLGVILPSIGGLNSALAQGKYSAWLVQSVDPITASRGGGLGFNPIAEIYLNFGVIGGVFGFLGLSLLIQLGLARFSNYGLPLHAILSGVALNTLLFWPRAETLNLIRPLFWFIIFPALWVMISTRRQAQRNG